MKKTVNKLALISFFAVSACSGNVFDGWFNEKEPLASELGQRTPSMNSSVPSAFPDPMSASYGNAPIDAMMPPMGGGSMPQPPEPPAFIGSTGVQTSFPTAGAQPFANPMSSQQAGLPMMSPVDMSAANNSATGLPVQRRAPAFNQSLGIVPEGKATAFPKLAQIPSTPIAPISAEADSRVAQMKADLDASRNRITPVDAPITIPTLAKVTPIQPETARVELPKVTPITPKFVNKTPVLPVVAEAPIARETSFSVKPVAQPSARAEVPSTNFANLKPLPNQPIYKIADEPKAMGEKPRVLNTQGAGSMERAQNITRLSDLRPISGSRKTAYSSARSSNPAGGRARMGIARHSTYYGGY